MRVVGVFRSEGLSELAVVESAITILIVALEKELAVISCDIHANIGKAVLQIERGNRSQVIDIKDAESVIGVEVSLLNSLIL